MKPPAGHAAGNHRQVGGQAGAARKSPQHGCLVAKHLKKDIRHQVFAVGRRERHLTAAGRFRNHMGHQTGKLGYQSLPAAVAIATRQTSLHQLPIGGSSLLNRSRLR